MKISTPTRLSTAVFLTAILIIFSCKKETSDTLTPQDEEQANVAATQSDAESEDVFNGVFDDVVGVNKDVAIGSTGIFGRTMATNYGYSDADGRVDNTLLLPSCLHTTIETTANTFPIKITLDFGSTGCVANDGHWRKGKIIIAYSSRLLYPGAVATTNFEDFYIDSIHFDNATTLKISNTGSTDKLQFTVEIDAKLAKPNGSYSEWHSRKVVTRIYGNLTTSPIDDVFTVDGYASGKVKRSDLAVGWEAKITKPLVKKFACRWISDGTVTIARLNLSSSSQWVGTLDYGYLNGTCDNRALLTVNNKPHEITLR